MRAPVLAPVFAAALAAGVVAAASGAHAQSAPMPGMDMPPTKSAPAKPAPAAPVKTAPAKDEMDGMAGMDMPSDPHAGHDMGAMHHDMAGMDIGGMAGMDHMAMSGNLGAYPMTRDVTGTAWQPDSARHEGWHFTAGAWSLMAHGEATLVYDDQGGPRGTSKTFVESFGMISAQRLLGGGTLTLRGHGSLDPTIGKAGYPLLLQTGETADGVHGLVDRQHPHDLVDELSVTYSHPISPSLFGGLSGFVYAAYPGEPALGPVTYLHRGSGMVSPETPIDHHWLDSTHVAFGVVTTGVVIGSQLKLEGSTFKGREPDQYRWDFDSYALDSYSLRATWNPTADLSMQVSRGWMHSPEQLEPEVDQTRTTASATYNRTYTRGWWQTTLAWGQDDNRSPATARTTNAWLAESALAFGPHTVFARAEQADKDELFEAPSPLAGRAFKVGKLSAGYAYSIPAGSHFVIDLGGLVSVYSLPSAIEPAYGSDPRSFMLFTRVRLK